MGFCIVHQLLENKPTLNLPALLMPCVMLQQMLALFIVAGLLTVKSAWLVVGAWILRKAYRRRYFYPLSCLPEMVAMCILLWPGFLSGLVGEQVRTMAFSTPDSLVLCNEHACSPKL